MKTKNIIQKIVNAAVYIIIVIVLTAVAIKGYQVIKGLIAPKTEYTTNIIGVAPKSILDQLLSEEFDQYYHGLFSIPNKGDYGDYQGFQDEVSRLRGNLTRHDKYPEISTRDDNAGIGVEEQMLYIHLRPQPQFIITQITRTIGVSTEEPGRWFKPYSIKELPDHIRKQDDLRIVKVTSALSFTATSGKNDEFRFGEENPYVEVMYFAALPDNSGEYKLLYRFNTYELLWEFNPEDY